MQNNTTGKVKVIKVEVLERDEHKSEYKVLDDLVAKFHDHLAEAKIALALNFGWSEDQDGHIKLGNCKKGSDLDRELHGYDFVISLNPDFLRDKNVTAEQKRALLDHELSHAGISIDDQGDTKRDDKGRPVYRIKKHDVEEFQDVFARHGLWKKDLQDFAAVLNAKKRNPIIALAEENQKIDEEKKKAGNS